MGYKNFEVGNVNFKEDCLVIFTFVKLDGSVVRSIYNRPQNIDDSTLGREAMVNSKDMLKNNYDFKDLVSIFIARSIEQYDSHIGI